MSSSGGGSRQQARAQPSNIGGSISSPPPAVEAVEAAPERERGESDSGQWQCGAGVSHMITGTRPARRGKYLSTEKIFNTVTMEGQEFLAEYRNISNKLKKRFLRRPNVSEASDQFRQLGKRLEDGDEPQYAAYCHLATGSTACFGVPSIQCSFMINVK